jgi:hypothetical protein
MGFVGLRRRIITSINYLVKYNVLVAAMRAMEENIVSW